MMSNMSEDIWYAGSNTRPPMLDRTDFESCQQRIRLYFLGKDNGKNIMKSIAEGPFQMGTFIHTPAEDAEETEGALQLGPERARVFTDLSAEEKERYKADIRATNILLQVMLCLRGSKHDVHANEEQNDDGKVIQPTDDPLALVSNASNQNTYNDTDWKANQHTYPPQSINSKHIFLQRTINNRTFRQTARTMLQFQDDRVVVQDVRGRYNANNQGRPFQRNNARGNVVARNAGGQNRDGNVNPGEQVTNFDDDVDDLALNVDHVFEADQCDAFDSDVDEAPTTQTMFMVNLSSEDPIYDEAGPSYDSNTPFEVQDHDTFVDHMDEYHEVHEMQSDVQHNYVVDSDADYTSDSNIIPYDQYVEDNEEHVVQSNVSSVRNDALMSILDEMHEQGVQSRSANKQVKVVNDTLTSELARYKELVGVYEQRAKFELTDRERKIDEQMRIIISDRNRKETSLKSELHSAQLQLRSTLNHHKIVREEAIILKKDFKQKEDKFLEEFLDIKRLKEKVEDRLYKQDQSVQTVHMICKPKSFYDEKNKVAIGYKNPLCLTRAKQVQPALYNGHVLVMSNHARPVVHDSEDTRDMAEITRKRMMEKMKSPLYENDRKKAETSVPKPLSALTVYPPNTPVKLVPRVLPTKSQVKINLYVLTQLFTEFDKTCKKRITPTCVTEGERGFEQTKRCYLTEVIPFFKTLKEHFAGVQTALFKEVKVMEEIFDQMNDEVDQNTVDKQCAKIVKKNLLIENENLIANCLSNQLLYDVEKSRCLDLEAEMSKVHNESKHISKLEREYLNLQLKYQHLQESFDNNKSQTSQEAPDFKIKNLEHQIQEKDNVIRDLKVLVSNVNDRSCEPYNDKDVTDLLEQNERLRAEIEKVKQHYKEMFESIKITRASTNEKTSSLLTQIKDLKAKLEGNLKVATRSPVKTKVLALGMYAIDVEQIPPCLKNNRSAHLNYINHLKESVETVREIVEEARIVKPLDSTLNSAYNKAPSTPVNRKKQVTFNDKPGTSSSNIQIHEVHQKVQLTNIPMIPSTGVNTSTEASRSKPRSNTKKNRILPAKTENNKKVEDHPRTNKSTGKKVALGKLNCGYQWRPTGKKFALGEMCPLTKLSMSYRSSFGIWAQAVQNIYGDSFIVAFIKHSSLFRDINGADLLKGIRSTNFYTISIDDMMKSSPIFLLSKASKSKSGCASFVVSTKQSDNIQQDNGTEFVNQVMSKYYKGVGIFYQKSVLRTPQQNGVVERQNRTLVEATRTMLIFSKASMFLWAEAVATACYTQNRSLIHTHHNKTLMSCTYKKSDLTFPPDYWCFLCYPTNDREDLGKFQAKADIGIFVGYAPSRKGYRIYNKRTRLLMETIHVTFDEMYQTMDHVRMSSGPEPIIMTPGQLKSGLAPTDKELEMLFQPMFDEYLKQSRVNEPVPSATAVNAQVVPPGTSLSTTIAQDAPSTSASSSTSEMHHPVRHQGIGRKNPLSKTPQSLTMLYILHLTLLLENLVRHSHHLGMLIQRNPTKLLNHQIISEDGPKITLLITSLAIHLVLLNPKNIKMVVKRRLPGFQAMQDEIHEFDHLKYGS
ncbi:retrovirus-related pol polyprotein from transposon TNT 1-94 [Tanacetum coccineum]